MGEYPDFPWDDDQAVTLHGEEAQQIINAMLMRAADDAPTVEEALQRLKTGRPRVGEKREETKLINVRIPQTWLDTIDALAHQLGKTRSQVIRDSIYQRIAQRA